MRNKPAVFIATAALVVSLGANVATQGYAFQANKQASQSHAALCTFKSDLAARAAQSQKLLDDNPGDPVRVYSLVIARAQLITSAVNQKATVDSLAALKC